MKDVVIYSRHSRKRFPKISRGDILLSSLSAACNYAFKMFNVCKRISCFRWLKTLAGATEEASLETVMSHRRKHYSALTVNDQATFMRSQENFKRNSHVYLRRLLLSCFSLVCFGLVWFSSLSRIVRRAYQVSFRAPKRVRLASPRRDKLCQPLVP